MSNSICMLASPFKVEKVTFPCYMDIKLDGVRGFVKYEDKINIYSRNNKILRNFITIENQLRILYEIYVRNFKTVNIDGEILNGHFQNLMRMVNRKIDGVEMAKNSTYTIFDVKFNHILNMQLNNRLSHLANTQRIIKNNNLINLNVNIGKIAYCNNDIENFYNETLTLGFEGIMIKNLNSVYECKRSYNWMKMKPTKTEDIKIIDVKEGTGKYEGMLGAFICKLLNGNIVNVGSGFTDYERFTYWENSNRLIGKIIEVKFQEKTLNGNLRFSKFVKFRDDI